MNSNPSPFASELVRSVRLVLAAVGLALLAQRVGAQDSLVPAAEQRDSRIEDTSSEARAITIKGRVVDDHGSPVEGAMVVSTAGGSAVSARDGSFRLELAHFPWGASAQVTAVATVSGRSSMGSVQIKPTTPTPDVGSVLLQAGASCTPSWVPTFGQAPGVNGVNVAVTALTTFDDGTGPALHVGGLFTSAGGIEAGNIAKWDGSNWSALASGLEGTVEALTVFDDGSGPALYAGGDFITAGGVTVNGIAKWNGSTWSALGSGMGFTTTPSVVAFAIFDDGSGPALYAGGQFTSADGVGAKHIAKWDGSRWSALGSGVGGPNASVLGLTVFDDGSGAALYAGGEFTTAGGAPAKNIAKWGGSSWSALGSGVNGSVLDLTVFDDGGGAALYAGGSFTTANGNSARGVAKWNGSSWSALGFSFGVSDGLVSALAVFDDGSGPALAAGGDFTFVGGITAYRVARWDGSSWSALHFGVNAPVYALGLFNDGGGEALYAGGFFTTSQASGAVPVENRIAKWDGSRWSALGEGVEKRVRALAVYDSGDGYGPALYAGGEFAGTGTLRASRIVKWNGSSWSVPQFGMSGTLTPDVDALTIFNDGSGTALYAGGKFTVAGIASAKRVAKWNGSSWSALGSGIDGTSSVVWALAGFDDGGGPALFAGGDFATAGGVAANRIARWNGSIWSALGTGMDDSVQALAVFDDGGGPALYAGGLFTTADGVSANHIAKWNGSSWSPLGNGMDDGVFALTVFDGGGGPALYAGGDFTTAHGVAANRIAKWNGSSWLALGSGMDDRVSALAGFDDGGGSALYAGGEFTTADGVAAARIARWDGSSWSALDSGMTDSVDALAVFHDGSGLALCAGGAFSTSSTGDSYLAKWAGCICTGAVSSYCTAQTNSSGCTPSIGSSGIPSASAGSGFSITAAQVLPNKVGVLFYGINGPGGGLFQGGHLCATPPTKRTPLQTSTSPGSPPCAGSYAFDFNARIASGIDANLVAGQRVWSQYWTRDGLVPSGTGLTNGLTFVICH